MEVEKSTATHGLGEVKYRYLHAALRAQGKSKKGASAYCEMKNKKAGRKSRDRGHTVPHKQRAVTGVPGAKRSTPRQRTHCCISTVSDLKPRATTYREKKDPKF